MIKFTKAAAQIHMLKLKFTMAKTQILKILSLISRSMQIEFAQFKDQICSSSNPTRNQKSWLTLTSFNTERQDGQSS